MVTVGDYVKAMNLDTIPGSLVRGIIGVVVCIKKGPLDTIEIKTPSEGPNAFWTIWLESPKLEFTRLSTEEYFYAVLKYADGIIR